MAELTWPITSVILALVLAIAYMYGKTTNEEIRKQILGYVEKIVTFIIGAATGGAVTGTAVYFNLIPG